MDKSREHINPSAISPETLAKMLNLHASVVQKHIDMGAPIAADGTISRVRCSKTFMEVTESLLKMLLKYNPPRFQCRIS